MTIWKTRRMVEIENQHGGRDIRDLFGEAFERFGALSAAAVALGADRSSGTIWLSSRYLGGSVEKSDDTVRLTFAGWPRVYSTARRKADRVPAGVAA